MLISLLATAVTSGAVGYWLGRRRRDPEPVTVESSKVEPQDEQALWMLRSKAEGDSGEVVRMRFVHINDVYIMDNLPKLRKLLDDCSYGLRRENLIVSIGGDLLSPYPLSTLDKGRGMVDVMLESGVQFACFGNHEADVGLPALKKRLERWHERGGVWINTNMPDLLPELQLPSYASVVGLSKDGHNSRQVCLVGVCTKDPSLYNAPDDFGGAVYTALDCNEAALQKSQTLMEAHVEDTEAQKVDAVVALTHQDLEVDIELAKKATAAGIYAVLGGHDHTEYAMSHNGCALLKAGMDAKNAAVMDLFWNTEDTVPCVDSFQLISLSKFTSSKAVYRSVEKHMRKVWKMEREKALVHLTVFQTLMSSKDIRKKQTTLGSFLCSALRDELEVDCVLFDGGNIRGDRDYEPNPEHYLGSKWTFTLADLEQELPWSSEMVIIVLPGSQLSRAVQVSRTVKLGSGGFLQTDGGIHVDPTTSEVRCVGNETLDPSRIYRIGVMHASLAGMNDNPVFKEWSKTHIMPQEDSGKPAKELLKKQFARRMWDKMPEFHEINVSKTGILSREDWGLLDRRMMLDVGGDDEGGYSHQCVRGSWIYQLPVHRLAGYGQRACCGQEVRNAYVQTFTRCAEADLSETHTGLVSADGQSLPSSSTLLEAGILHGDTLTAVVQAANVVATQRAFAMWFCDGEAFCWGAPGFGGRGPPDKLQSIQQIAATGYAFAAVKVDHRRGETSVVIWGHRGFGGTCHPEIQDQLKHVVRIEGNTFNFAAILQDGSVLTWGRSSTKRVRPLSDVQKVVCSFSAFAAILSDGKVVTWGQCEDGGNSGKVAKELEAVREVTGSSSAFAALRNDGSVIAWGKPACGGDTGEVDEELKDVLQIHSSWGAFAAILEDRTVVCWGDPDKGGDAGSLHYQLKEVQSIAATGSAFAAVLADASVLTWGDPLCGGDSSEMQEQLRNVREVRGGSRAFAAICLDGTVAAWGDIDCGGDTSAVQQQLVNVQEIHASERAFVAVLTDGKVVCWGHSEYGGNCAGIQDWLDAL
ncbi:3'-cyclic-nucleotide 2'-phosphodiesterase/3'-nucleotidase [Durusdinium trenchii]|uniref:3'-cyclic-nucleotide 2'-phosphodiesterase/3'-nucleotidase n=2 Tax=Durusdinium trenchii TaxID=1381693 RepID=A0ABP0HMA6_9DINO